MNTETKKQMPDWFYNPTTPEEKTRVRVAIAKDAIQWARGIGFFKNPELPKANFRTQDTYLRLRAKEPRTLMGDYGEYVEDTIRIEVNEPGMNSMREVQDVLVKEVAHCDVCGLGALFVADVLKHDRLTVGSFWDEQWAGRLKRAFNEAQMVEIESHFEDDHVVKPFSQEALNYATPKKLRMRFEQFLDRKLSFKSSDERKALVNEVAKYRFIAICHNIIDHGAFFPSRGVRKPKK